jgi:hypothetical protein
LQLNYALVTDPADGLAKDGKFDMEGFKNVVRLRAQFGGSARQIRPRNTSTSPSDQKALAGL